MAAIPVKILVLGDTETGKTSLIRRLVHDRFYKQYKPSHGVDFQLCEVTFNGRPMHLQFWDVSGESRSPAKVYFKDLRGAMVVYDVTRPRTFDSVLEWRKILPETLPVLLVGNKQDMESAQPDELSLDAFCAEHHFTTWFDTSAKTGRDVHEAVLRLVADISTGLPETSDEGDDSSSSWFSWLAGS
mmetsp:Transcript_33286/g.106261  ORF Transcript_33286/g.106261 Transcript_33286/m.106261 type:complete len:186 (+) Transcript_33286:102-659(+)